MALFPWSSFLCLKSISGSQSTKQSQNNWCGDELLHEPSDEERLVPRARYFSRKRPRIGSPQSEPGKSHGEICEHTPPLARRSIGHKAPQVSGTKSKWGSPNPSPHSDPEDVSKANKKRTEFALRPVTGQNPRVCPLGNSWGDALGFVFLGED